MITQNNMKIAIMVSCALLSGQAASQTNFIRDEYSEIAQTVQRHTSFASSERNFDQVPLFEINKYIFITILGNPELLNSLDREDQQILSSLPDHHDARFTGPAMLRMQETCQQILDGRDTLDASDMASLLQRTTEQNQEALNAHYQEVFNSLSNLALNLVEKIYSQVNGTQRITHSSVDYVALSQEMPDLVRNSHTRSCEGITAATAKPRTALLSDIFSQAHRDSE